jgi:hypothetical protein
MLAHLIESFNFILYKNTGIKLLIEFSKAHHI